MYCKILIGSVFNPNQNKTLVLLLNCYITLSFYDDVLLDYNCFSLFNMDLGDKIDKIRHMNNI